MALVATYADFACQPAHSLELARARPVRLPVGGPVGVGGAYKGGTILGAVTGTTAANEVRTLTVSGSPTKMVGYLTYVYGNGSIVTASTANTSGLPTSAQLQTLFDSIFGVGNTSVALASNVYTVTFQNLLGNVRIGGNLTFTPTFTGGTSPSVAWATTTQGIAGTGQYDAYASGNSDGTQVPKCILVRDYMSDPVGGSMIAGFTKYQPESPVAWFTGFFCVGGTPGGGLPLIGLDSNAVGSNAFGFHLSEGTSVTDTNAIIRLG